jgi:Flp pilus assembly protein TadG
MTPREEPDVKYGGWDTSGPPAHQVRSPEIGQATVELAVTLTLLLLVLVGALDLGRAFFSYVSIVNAAREGARYGAEMRAPGAIAPAVQREVSGNGLDPALLSVTYSWGGQGRPVRVTVVYPFRPITTGILPFGQITLSSSATMMIP